MTALHIRNPEKVELDTMLDGLTRTTTSRARAQAEIDRQVKEFLRKGGRIEELSVADTACTTNSYTWNKPISENSQRILETFKNRHKRRRTH